MAHKGESREAPGLRTRDPTASLTRAEVKAIWDTSEWIESRNWRIVRRAYAKQIMVPLNAADPRVEAAFAVVRREAFLGPGPWPILHFDRYVTTPSDDPVYLYQDALVGIIPDRGVNKGSRRCTRC